MVFPKDDLHGDLFASVLFIQWIFFGSCELADISQMSFITHCQSYCKTFYLLCLKISELDSTYVYSRTFFFFDLMVGVTHFGCIEHILSSHRAFMIDMHDCTIYDDMDSSTFEHSVDCVESLQISTL